MDAHRTHILSVQLDGKWMEGFSVSDDSNGHTKEWDGETRNENIEGVPKWAVTFGGTMREEIYVME